MEDERRAIDRSDYARAYALVSTLRALYVGDETEMAGHLRDVHQEDRVIRAARPPEVHDDGEFLAREFAHAVRVLSALANNEPGISTRDAGGLTVCSTAGCPHLTWFGECFDCRLRAAGMLLKTNDDDA